MRRIILSARIIGTGALLGGETDKRRGIERLRRELDLLKSLGIDNLRVLAGAEGEGLLNGITRVGPVLQPEKRKFDDEALKGLDLLLAEMRKRDMRAVIYLSNNWEWSGGFQQYLLWEKRIDPTLISRKPSWDELRYDQRILFVSAMHCGLSSPSGEGHFAAQQHQSHRVR